MMAPQSLALTLRVRKLLRDLGIFGAVIALYLLMMLVILPRLGYNT